MQKSRLGFQLGRELRMFEKRIRIYVSSYEQTQLLSLDVIYETADAQYFLASLVITPPDLTYVQL